ncbi:MAG: RluA family pseudouridine synthase [Candidatus Nomurabacteria bacterium]|nr:RluA family pseudouridine synthase [Candidatus Nomurabacteria bacterium]
MRLDAYLAEKYPEFSRSIWAKRIKNGDVSVNGKPVTNPSFTNFDDNSKFDIKRDETIGEPLDLPVIYEDENVIVINKPAGILTHSKGALNDEFTVSDFIKLRASHSDLPNNNRFGIVHRLDRQTSGVMIGAKNAATLKQLQRQFSERKTKKTYLAVVKGVPKNPEFRIDLPIARNPRTPSQFRVDPRGKSAITDVKVINKLIGGQTVLELSPLTGRTHQLRVHLAHVGLPIVGDPIYGEQTGRDFSQYHMMLHASQLEITIPGGDRKIFNATAPAQFEEKINA